VASSPLFCSISAPPPLLAGRGGEGLGVGSGDVAGSWCDNPRPPPSGDGGVAEMSGVAATVWCRGLPAPGLEAPPPNKLKAGWTLFPILGFPAASSSFSPLAPKRATSALLACHGGKGKSVCSPPRPRWSLWESGVEAAPSPRVVISPARVPVLPAELEWKGFASDPGRLFELSLVGRFPRHAAISLTAGCSLSAASVKNLLLLSPSVGLGDGRPLFRAHVRR
jgi:hypothetical protein